MFFSGTGVSTISFLDKGDGRQVQYIIALRNSR